MTIQPPTVSPISTPETSPAPLAPAGQGSEFIALVALTTSLVAMSIDTMLPALGRMASELGARAANDRQLILTVFFAGMTLGQFIYGPVSDSTGRKPALYAGIVLFVAGGLLCTFAQSFEVLLAGRALQGFGAAGPRIVAIALVRDVHAGRAMARVMSFVQTVFILVPVVAPSLGQGVLEFGSWRLIFAGLVVVALLNLSWFALRQPETLPRSRRRPFSLPAILRASRETLAHPLTLGYTVGSGAVFGAFIGYLATSQQVFQEQYAVGKLFPLFFGGLAASIGLASFVNGRLVVRFGMRALARRALLVEVGLSWSMVLVALADGGHLPLGLFVGSMAACFFCNGLLFGNFSARAMEPMGHIAGVAAAVTGSVATFTALALGSAYGRAYDGTVLPLIAGYAISGLLALLVTEWAERRAARAPSVALRDAR